MDDARLLAPVEDVPEEGTRLVTLRDREAGADVEAILLRAGGDVVAWRNHCQHWTDVRLDKGSGATVRNGEIMCGKHGATFQADTGYCDFGPCEGAYLVGVDVTVADGGVYLADEDYEFVGHGPAEEKTLDDLSSTGERMDF